MEMVRQVQHTSVYTNAEHEMQSLEISENTGLSKRSVRTISSKDTNNRKKKLKLSKQKPSAFNDIIQYGHELKALYEEQSRTDETVKQELMVNTLYNIPDLTLFERLHFQQWHTLI